MEYKPIGLCRKVWSILSVLFCCEHYTIMEVTTVELPHILCHGIELYIFTCGLDPSIEYLSPIKVKVTV